LLIIKLVWVSLLLWDVDDTSQLQALITNLLLLY